jgi:hypothetical protein
VKHKEYYYEMNIHRILKILHPSNLANIYLYLLNDKVFCLPEPLEYLFHLTIGHSCKKVKQSRYRPAVAQGVPGS